MPSALQTIKAAFLDCMSTSTGHGLPQMVKPGNLFLNVLWFMFVAVAIGSCSYFIYLALDQYTRYDVVTMTQIRRETQMTMPAVTMRLGNSSVNIQDSILECGFGYFNPVQCKTNNLTLVYHKDGKKYNAVQLNHGLNKTELQQAKGEGWEYGYRLVLYLPPWSLIFFAVTDNSVQVVSQEMKHWIYPGLEASINLAKTVQNSLGPPYSSCTESLDYRQVNCLAECNKNGSVIDPQCNLQCPVECNQVNFALNRMDAESTFSKDKFEKYISITSTRFNTTGMSDAEIKKGLTDVYIYFNTLETTEITQSPSMSSTNLIGNVGGLLGTNTILLVNIFPTNSFNSFFKIGLFLGFSLLSSIEALDLLVRISLILKHTFKGSSRTSP